LPTSGTERLTVKLSRTRQTRLTESYGLMPIAKVALSKDSGGCCMFRRWQLCSLSIQGIAWLLCFKYGERTEEKE
jgi:hypothetical protein